MYSEKWRDFHLRRVTLVVDRNHRMDIRQSLEGKKKYTKVRYEVPLESIVSQETLINNPIHVETDVDGVLLEFNVGHTSSSTYIGKEIFPPQKIFSR